jgi:hypothetical protein
MLCARVGVLFDPHAADEQSRGTRLCVETNERAKKNHEAAGCLASGVESDDANASRFDEWVAELRSPRS